MKRPLQFGIKSLLVTCAGVGICMAALNYYKEHDDWGELSGQIVDQNDPAHGIPNVLVILKPERGTVVPIHESYSNSLRDPVVVSVSPSGFDTEFVLVRTCQDLKVVNNDSRAHNVSPVTFNSMFSGNQPVGSNQTFRFSEPERLPGQLLCDLVPELNVPIMVSDHPYMATTDSSGKFHLSNVPAGEWSFMFWHPDCGYLRKLSMPNHKVSRRGETTISIRGFFGTNIGIATTPKPK